MCTCGPDVCRQKLGSVDFSEHQNPKTVKGFQDQTFLRRPPPVFSMAWRRDGGLLVYTEEARRKSRRFQDVTFMSWNSPAVFVMSHCLLVFQTIFLFQAPDPTIHPFFFCTPHLYFYLVGFTIRRTGDIESITPLCFLCLQKITLGWSFGLTTDLLIQQGEGVF